MKLIIIGNGVAGISCALEARKRDAACEITVVSGETDYFFSRTALMYSFMDRMTRRDLEPYERDVYEHQRIELVRDWVVDFDHFSKEIQFKSGKRQSYDKLVFALGAAPVKIPWKGVDYSKPSVLSGVVNFVSMQDLEACEKLVPGAQQAVVVGGGLVGIELAESLAHHGIAVTFLIREPHFFPVALGSQEAARVCVEMRLHGIEVLFEEEIAEVEEDANGRVKGVRTNKGTLLAAQILGVCVGVKPNVDFLKSVKTPPALARGILVNENLETSMPGVFACGDCAEIQLPNSDKLLLETIWYSAKRQGTMVGKNIFGKPQAYVPPTFFNSSKFFELEYTTAGEVTRVPPESVSSYLEIPARNASLRIVHLNNKVIGFNALGARFDHELLCLWIEEERTPEYCLKNLKKAQFDVEFGRIPFQNAQVSNCHWRAK